MRGIGVSGGVGWVCDTWCAYMNRFSPAPPSHCGRFTLILKLDLMFLGPMMEYFSKREQMINLVSYGSTLKQLTRSKISPKNDAWKKIDQFGTTFSLVAHDALGLNVVR